MFKVEIKKYMKYDKTEIEIINAFYCVEETFIIKH